MDEENEKKDRKIVAALMILMIGTAVLVGLVGMFTSNGLSKIQANQEIMNMNLGTVIENQDVLNQNIQVVIDNQNVLDENLGVVISNQHVILTACEGK